MMRRSSRSKHEAQFPVYLASVTKFFTVPENWEAVYPYLKGEKMSRRFLEHFITEYARAYRCEYYVTDPTSGERYLFNVYHQAQAVLLGVHKRHMDPFSRRNRSATNNGFFEFGHGDRKCMVTVCELIFFRWALKKKVLEYAEQHEAEIKADMARMARVKRESTNASANAKPASANTADGKVIDEIVIELPPPENPLQDTYWRSATQEKKQMPRKQRKRYRTSAVSTVFNEDIEERDTFHECVPEQEEKMDTVNE